jgi:hypothetical protein
MSNIIQLSKPCAFCDSRENVQLFAGLMLCGNCQENIRITNPGMFEANDQIEQKNRVNLVFNKVLYFYVRKILWINYTSCNNLYYYEKEEDYI